MVFYAGGALVVFTMTGCGVFNAGKECVKTVWGSSTRALEDARGRAITKTYAQPYWDVLKAAVKSVGNNKYVVFKKDEVKGYLVLMGIPGSIDTTEVGVFFVELPDSQTRVEISSLSTNAKRAVAQKLFHDLDIAAGLAPPDEPAPEMSPPALPLS